MVYGNYTVYNELYDYHYVVSQSKTEIMFSIGGHVTSSPYCSILFCNFVYSRMNGFLSDHSISDTLWSAKIFPNSKKFYFFRFGLAEMTG
jgi:hypothetical protein